MGGLEDVRGFLHTMEPRLDPEIRKEGECHHLGVLHRDESWDHVPHPDLSALNQGGTSELNARLPKGSWCEGGGGTPLSNPLL